MPRSDRKYPNALISDAGPFDAESRSDGTILLKPHWTGLEGKPSYRRQTEEDHADAGGPGIFTRMGTATAIAQFLNERCHKKVKCRRCGSETSVRVLDPETCMMCLSDLGKGEEE